MAEGFDFAGTASGAVDQACLTVGADVLKGCRIMVQCNILALTLC